MKYLINLFLFILVSASYADTLATITCHYPDKTVEYFGLLDHIYINATTLHLSSSSDKKEYYLPIELCEVSIPIL